MTATDLFMINKTARWVDLCRFADLEPEWGEAALVDGIQLAVFRLWDDRVVITANLDPRTGAAVISRGIVGSRGGCPTIASPLHKESYSLLTGDCFSDPDLHLDIFDCRVVDGRVEVDTSYGAELADRPYQPLSA
ncbi:nitrite reductase small subunit NirD [Microlunatus soli]|uniref:Nitrite reductase (NADH) small subunit n=1 Tax=Microlunatus soli TaxID=630515 RepID=A0A1H1VC63_9ACTN|nr:nitrite reductase small subunit NirD [Microlunatus soli]SDS82051.1 nitrite reductase (NADH) small subunit [Microlunatus soli]